MSWFHPLMPWFHALMSWFHALISSFHSPDYNYVYQYYLQACFLPCVPLLPSQQEIARGTGGGVDDSINLDVHAISELKSKGFPPTNDLPKYNYTADASGKYSKLLQDSVLTRIYRPKDTNIIS